MNIYLHTDETVNNFINPLTISFKIKPYDLYYMDKAW
jgi:hypothetical protein